MNDLQFELGSLERDLDQVEEEIAEIEARLDDYDELEARLDGIREDLVHQRTLIEQLEDDAVTQFNEHMTQVMDRLGYENLERVWLERLDETVGTSRFELHIVRSVDDGRAYEDTVDHLSESEREVVGLVFALAGYLVHEVHRECPFMLLDSLEALDAPRIAALVGYMNEYVDYLVVALLPEDAEAVDESYDRITNLAHPDTL